MRSVLFSETYPCVILWELMEVAIILLLLVLHVDVFHKCGFTEADAFFSENFLNNRFNYSDHRNGRQFFFFFVIWSQWFLNSGNFVNTWKHMHEYMGQVYKNYDEFKDTLFWIDFIHGFLLRLLTWTKF